MAIMGVLKLACVVLFCYAFNGASADSLNFQNWFKTNMKEFNEVPITFDKPIPTWIKGSLVSYLFIPSTHWHIMFQNNGCSNPWYNGYASILT